MDWVSVVGFIAPLVSVCTAAAFFPGVTEYAFDNHIWVIGALFILARVEVTALEWFLPV